MRKLRRSGFNPTAYVVDLQAKLVAPAPESRRHPAGDPLRLSLAPRAGVVASLGASITLGFAYWIVISIGISLGHAGKLAPVLAAWLPNVFFLCLAGYLWLHLEQ